MNNILNFSKFQESMTIRLLKVQFDDIRAGKAGIPKYLHQFLWYSILHNWKLKRTIRLLKAQFEDIRAGQAGIPKYLLKIMRNFFESVDFILTLRIK